MGAERWTRLAADLAAIGVDAKVTERGYSEAIRGRARNGVSRSITIRLGGGAVVEIHDTWWRKNPDVWTGWTVGRCDADGITRTMRRGMKHRAEVVAAASAMLTVTEASPR